MSVSDHSDFERALRRSGDLNRRLEGEDLETRYVEDARHWETVYRELHSFKISVLNTAEEQGRNVPDGGRSEVDDDLTILRAEARRLATRLDYWRRRRAELER